jgi:hypothetical protein
VDGFPPQLAIVPVLESCTLPSLSAQSAPPGVIAPARAWLQASPPPSRPGMTAGIITRWAVNWTVACPAAGHGSQVAVGGGCEAWSVTLTTATGAFDTSCGDITGSVACTSATAQPNAHQFSPDIGDVLYVPDSGQVTRAADITFISQIPWDDFSASPPTCGCP